MWHSDHMPGGPKISAGPVDVAAAHLIDEARAAQHVSQAALGARVGLSQTQVSRVLRGVKPMTLPEFLGLCSALGLSPSDVMAQAEARTR